jgi:ABC-type transport system substrate-binding protein
MFKKNLKLALAFLALTLLIAIPNRAFASPSNPPKNPYELILDRPLGTGVPSIDPAIMGTVMEYNIYERLITFDGERYDVYEPMLATQVWVGPPQNNPALGPTSPSYTNYTVYFKIRVGVPFHNYSRTDVTGLTWSQYYLTTEDVQYSIQRYMVHDYPSSENVFYIFPPLLDCSAVNTTDPTFGDKIANAVQRNDTFVWLNICNPSLAPATGSVSFTPVRMFETEDGAFNPTFWSQVVNLPLDYPTRILFQILAEPWTSVMSKQWILDFVIPYGTTNGIDLNPDVPGIQFEWDGNFSHWADYTLWGESPFDKIPVGSAHPGVTCGTGPYILDRYDPTYGGEESYVKFDDYWGGWPSKYPSPPYSPEPSSGIKPAGYVTRFTSRERSTSVTLSELASGDCDIAPDLTRADAGLLHQGEDIEGPTIPGIRLNFYPELEVMTWHFTFFTAPTPDNRYGIINANDTLSENAIPANFFNDTHVRKAFAYLINYTMLIHDGLLGEGYQPVTCAPSGMPYVNPNQQTYYQNITQAVAEFSLAFGGRLGTTGFTVNLYYTLFDIWKQQTDQIAATINQIGTDHFGGKFHANSLELSGVEFWPAFGASELPAYPNGWIGDYADIDNFIECYMSSSGFWAAPQLYSNPEADSLLVKGLRTPDGPARQAIYYRLEEIYFEDCPSVPCYVETARWYSRTWCQGQQPSHPFYTMTVYARWMWKWEYLPGNVNFDNKVDMGDIVAILDAFGSYYGKGNIPIIHPKWNFYCDVIGNPYPGWYDRKVDMYDVTQACDNFGKTQAVWTPP